MRGLSHRLRLNPMCFLCRKQWGRLFRTGHWLAPAVRLVPLSDEAGDPE